MGALTAAADRAADALLERAIGDGERVTWLGATMGLDGAVQRTGDPTLYDGSAGIALAAWAVAPSLGRDDLAELAVAAARHALSAQDRVRGMGLFDGLAGIGLAAHIVGLPAGREVLARVAQAPHGELDLIGGSAGIVLALLAIGDVPGAIRHGEHLLTKADRHPWGWSWGDGLCGLAHGSSGQAWALGELAAATGEARFAEAATAARRHERAWFDPTHNSWPDLRPEALAAAAVTRGDGAQARDEALVGRRHAAVTRGDGATSSPHALLYPALWCHGATGIGLARLGLHARAPRPDLAAEAACALQAATADAFAGGADLTLCHGLGGTILLLLAAHETLGEPEHLDAARWIATRALEQLEGDPGAWPSGVPGGAFSPGLMTGLAGAMYVLARAEDPQVPGLPALSTYAR
jgi:lantibiotic modifying enzyme